MEIKGLNFCMWDERGLCVTEEKVSSYISSMNATGANTVFINYQYAYDTVSGNRVNNAYPSWNINQNTSVDAVESAIKLFKQAGLNVVLAPHTNAWDSATQSGLGNMNTWNIDMSKLNVSNFLANYKNQVLEAALISQKYSLPILDIGVEMNFVDQSANTKYWNDLIDEVRQIYNGKLTYSGLTNIYNEPDARGVEFYNKLDYIGLTLYPSLGYENPNSSVKDLFESAYDTKHPFNSQLGSWQTYLEALQAKFKKPILVVETGFPSVDGAANSFVSPSLNKAIDAQEQSDATFAWLSFLANFPSNELVGLAVWSVSPSDLLPTDGHGNFTGADWMRDNYDLWYQRSFEIIGKPVEKTLRDIFHATNNSTILNGLIFNADIKSGSLKGTLGCDLFNLGLGKYDIDGGMSLDTARFAQSVKEFTLEWASPLNFVVSNSSSSHTLINIERLFFSDASVALDTGKGETGGEAYRLYKAAFDRTPDQEGLGYWINAFDHGADLTGVASSFIASPEFAAMYGANSTDTNFVTLLYNHVLHRNPDAEGNAYWLNALQHGMTRGAVLASFSESPENIAQTAQLIANGIQYQEWLG